jgi:hypothetical protein
MKLLIFTSLLLSSIALAHAEDELTFGGLIKNRKTGDQIVMKCIDASCKSKDIFLIKKQDDSVILKKLNKRPFSENENPETSFIKENAHHVAVLPNIETPYFYSIGWFYDLTGIMWGNIAQTRGAPFYVPAIIMGSLATPVTVALDTAGTVVIDTALILSYPLRKHLKGTKYTWKEGYKLVRVLHTQDEELTISNRKFKKLVKAISDQH